MPIRRQKHWGKVREGLRRNLRSIVAAGAIVYQKEVRVMLNSGNSRRGANPSHPGLPPHKFTSTLSKSWQTDMSRLNEPNPRARVGSKVKYARIHEYGGLIHARKKLLPVPVNQLARNWQIRSGGSIKGLPLKFVPARKGRTADHNTVGYLVLKHGHTKAGKVAKGAKPAMPRGTLMFVLKRRIFMPARPYARRAAKVARPKVRQLFSADRILKGIRGGSIR